MSRIPLENPSERRREQLSVWCSEEWYKKITNFAKAQNKSTSTLLLELAKKAVLKEEQRTLNNKD